MVVATKEREATKRESKWYLCPDCHGKGWVKSGKRFSVLQGVRILGHMPCPRCNGTLMIKSRDTEEEGIQFKSIKRCPKCKNWYAVGAGASQKEPCPHIHGDGKSEHCHWHDLSVFPPPDTEAGTRLRPEKTIEWEETASAP